MIYSAKKQDMGFKVVFEDEKTAFVPDDLGNSDRIQLQEWLDSGNQLEEEMDTALNQLKDEGTNTQINAIWRISDELVQVITLSIFGESDRIAGMTYNIKALYEKLDEGGVKIPSSAKQEIKESLVANGFSSVVKILNV